MVCKCCVPGCISNYESAGKEGMCSTFGFPWMKPIARIGFVIIQDNLIILVGIHVFA